MSLGGIRIIGDPHLAKVNEPGRVVGKSSYGAVHLQVEPLDTFHRIVGLQNPLLASSDFEFVQC